MSKLKFNKITILILSITLISLFFYSFRLKDTYIFYNDQSRDTLEVLRIWQDSKITLIGPPISFTEHTTREVFLGSLYLYIGLVGLVLSNFDPIGPVLPNIIIYGISTSIFFWMTKNFFTSTILRIFSTLLYVLSPVTVSHARLFWNPSLVIPAATFFWFFVLKKTSKNQEKINYLLGGIIAGIMFNFHYIVVIPLIIYLIILLIKKQVKGLFGIFGFLVGLLPIILFELRHNFYLTQAFVFNIFNGAGGISLNLGNIIIHFFNISWVILGVGKA